MAWKACGKKGLRRTRRGGLLITMTAPFRRIIRGLGVFALLISPALCRGQCRLSFPHDSNPTTINDDDICNFHQVDRDAYRGGRPRPSAYAKLAALGIRTIVNLEESKHANQERAAIEDLNRKLTPERRINFISFPINNTEINVPGVDAARTQALFQQIRDAPKPIFIHCYYGKDRTGAVLVLYRLARNEMSFEGAYQEAMHYRFDRLDMGLKRMIERYRDPVILKSVPQP